MIAGIVAILGGWRAAAFAALMLAAVAAAGWQTLALARAHTKIADMRTDNAKAAQAAAVDLANAQDKARKAEHSLATAVAAAADQYEKGKADAQAAADRVVADLAAGTLRLQHRWAGCETSRLSDTTAATLQFDAAAQSRRESAARIVRAAAECDAHVAGLQAVVLADRSAAP